jgi:hypothetical protein
MNDDRGRRDRCARSSPATLRVRNARMMVAAMVFMIGSISLVPAQQGNLESNTIDNTRNMRFCEILVVKESGVEIYNTTGVSDCPSHLWSALDLRKLRKQLHALDVEKNGPLFWMMDSQTASFGTKASFGGIKARWAAGLPLAADLEAVTGTKPYTVFSSKKTQKIVYLKGKPVYELVDPDGNIYVLQAHEERFRLDSLTNLGEMLNLPKGWQFRTHELTEDLILDFRPDQAIYAVGDEFHQHWTRISQSK